MLKIIPWSILCHIAQLYSRILSGITDNMFRHPAPAVTKCHVVFPKEETST